MQGLLSSWICLPESRRQELTWTVFMLTSPCIPVSKLPKAASLVLRNMTWNCFENATLRLNTGSGSMLLRPFLTPPPHLDCVVVQVRSPFSLSLKPSNKILGHSPMGEHLINLFKSLGLSSSKLLISKYRNKTKEDIIAVSINKLMILSYQILNQLLSDG